MPGPGFKVMFLRGALELRKRIKHSDAPLTPDCESLHDASEDYHWNESFYFNFMDTKKGIGGWIRMAKVPNQEMDTGAMVIYAGGQLILATLENGRVEEDEDCLKLGGLACCRDEPLKRWHLRFDGEMKIIENARRLPEANPDKLQSQTVELDLGFEGIGPCFNYGDPDLRALAEMLARPGTKLWDLRKLAKIFSEHYEQAGTVNGSIKIGNRGINFSGSGHRDHSWGPRDWTIPTTWTWLTGQFGEELAFNLNRMVIRSIDIFNGFITRDGKNYQLRRATLQTEFEEDGLTQRNIRFTLEDSGGFKLDVEGEALTVTPLQLESGHKRTLINEALTEYRFNDYQAYGISEYLHQLGDNLFD